MPFELDTPTLIIICAAISAVLFAETIYLVGFSTASYRSRVNRRLKLSKNQPDREAILIQLRRERGLTGDGLFRFGLQWFNRLLLESGMTHGVLTFMSIGALVALSVGVRHRKQNWLIPVLSIAAVMPPSFGTMKLRRFRRLVMGVTQTFWLQHI